MLESIGTGRISPFGNTRFRFSSKNRSELHGRHMFGQAGQTALECTRLRAGKPPSLGKDDDGGACFQNLNHGLEGVVAGSDFSTLDQYRL